MGEYVLLRGQMMKIGTCEDLYYVRHADYERLQPEMEQAPGNASPAVYLNGCSRFRFPFPDEDESADMWGIVGWDNFDRGEPVHAPDGWMAGLVDHNEAAAEVVGLYGRKIPRRIPVPRLRIPCPQSGQDVPGLPTTEPRYTYVEIVQQRPYDGALWTVCRCPYCGVVVRVPPDHAAELHLHMVRSYSDPGMLEIASRMMAGYTTATNTKREEPEP